MQSIELRAGRCHGQLLQIRDKILRILLVPAVEALFSSRGGRRQSPRVRDQFRRNGERAMTDVEKRGQRQQYESSSMHRYVVPDTKSLCRWVCEVVWSTQVRRLDIY